VSGIRRAVVVCAFGLAFLMLPAGSALAHPLGNFTVNRFSAIEVFPDHVAVHYVVDMAEIPSFQELRVVDSNHDERATSTELKEYASSLALEIRDNISLTTGTSSVDLQIRDARAGLSSGQGGLDVLRVDLHFTGDLQEAQATLNYVDNNYPDGLGWKEIVAYGTGGQGIVDSTVPSASSSNELRTYPQDLLTSPGQVDDATIQVAPGAAPAPSEPEVETPSIGPGDLFAGAFASLVEEEMTPAFAAFAVLLAIVVGALHALGPGHGKTVMAAYLIGSGGRIRHAVAVGIAISLMHTASVVALGLLTLWASSLFPPEAVFPYLSLFSGAVVLSLGAWLLWSRARAHWWKPSEHLTDADHKHTHDHVGEHGYTHNHIEGGGAHSHGFGSHTHDADVPEGTSPLSGKGLVALALSGGLLPSPTALVALLGAIALHRIAFGVTLVAAFSVGLAGALTLLGVFVLRARGYAARKFAGPRAQLLPIGSAALILGMGMFLTTRAALGL
jgi:nickel/cobalt transporter (NicO) family protein